MKQMSVQTHQTSKETGTLNGGLPKGALLFLNVFKLFNKRDNLRRFSLDE